jgi:hypothetical protein
MMTALLDKIKDEPVLVTALVQALVVLGVEFGLDLSSGQQGAILAVCAAVLAFVARSQVVPARNVDLFTKAD